MYVHSCRGSSSVYPDPAKAAVTASGRVGRLPRCDVSADRSHHTPEKRVHQDGAQKNAMIQCKLEPRSWESSLVLCHSPSTNSSQEIFLSNGGFVSLWKRANP